MLPPVLATNREIDLPLRKLKPDLGLRSRAGALKRAEVRPRAKRARCQVGCAVGDGRRWRDRLDFKGLGTGRPAEQTLEPSPLDAQLEFSRAHRLLRLQRRNPTAEQLDFGDLTARTRA